MLAEQSQDGNFHSGSIQPWNAAQPSLMLNSTPMRLMILAILPTWTSFIRLRCFNIISCFLAQILVALS